MRCRGASARRRHRSLIRDSRQGVFSVHHYNHVVAEISSVISLDRESEPWVGRWTGVGQVRIWADGTYDVLADPRSSVAPDEIERSLRFGWAELLSRARLGLRSTNGVTLVDTASHSDGSPVDGALLVTGSQRIVDPIVRELMIRGWQVLADRPAPIQFGADGVLAHSSMRPVVLQRSRSRSSSDSWDTDLPAVRNDSDAVYRDAVYRDDVSERATVGSQRSELEWSIPLRAIVVTDSRTSPGSVVTPVRGHAAAELASHLVIGGVLGFEHGDDPPTAMRQLLALTRSRMAVVYSGSATLDDMVSDLERWWQRL